jgi:hypothetical protein
MPIGDWDEGTLARFIEDAIQRDPIAAIVRQLNKGRVSWGLIRGSDGVKLAGTPDYTSARTGAGQYTITWATAKAGAAYAVVPVTDRGASGILVADYALKTATAFSVQTFPSTTGVTADPADWSFLVLDAQ